MSEPKVVAFLQNQWFKHPEYWKGLHAKHPDKREEMIARTLFMGCLTGRRLRTVFGEAWSETIVWEEISRMIGGKSNSVFPPSRTHIQGVLDKHEPDVVLVFGRVAERGLAWYDGVKIIGPHPAARSGAVAGLERMREELENGSF